MAEDVTVNEAGNTVVDGVETTLTPEEAKAVASGESIDSVNTELESEDTFEMPEKFNGKSPEDIARAYAELEKKLGEKKDENVDDSDTTTEVSPKEGDEDTTVPDDNKAEEPKVLSDKDMAEYKAEYDKDGKLSEESLSKLKAEGYSETDVNDYVQYQEYKAYKAVEALVTPLGGGVEKYNEVAQWVADNADDAELETINKTLANSALPAKQAYMATIYKAFEDATGGVNLHGNSPSKSTTAKGYSTQSEMFADMNNPAYAVDASYRAKVEAKVALTDASLF